MAPCVDTRPKLDRFSSNGAEPKLDEVSAAAMTNPQLSVNPQPVNPQPVNPQPVNLQPA
jgi:hypothetical protein